MRFQSLLISVRIPSNKKESQIHLKITLLIVQYVWIFTNLELATLIVVTFSVVLAFKLGLRKRIPVHHVVKNFSKSGKKASLTSKIKEELLLKKRQKNIIKHK